MFSFIYSEFIVGRKCMRVQPWRIKSPVPYIMDLAHVVSYLGFTSAALPVYIRHYLVVPQEVSIY